MAFEIEYENTWLTPALEDVVMYVIGGDWGKDPSIVDEEFVEVLCIRGSEIRDWSKNKGNTASIRAVKKTSLENRKLIEGDILLEISGGGPDQPVGRTVLIDKQTLSFQPSTPKVCTNFLRLLRFPIGVNSSFINLFFDFFYASGEIVKYQGGSNNLRNLKFAEFSKIEIPLPPLNEQHRIVSKIEEIFSELDNGVANLKLAQKQLKVYRQALLKHAFEGKLTEQWRRENNPEPAEKLLERIKAERQNRYVQELKEWKATVMAWEKDGKKGRKPLKPREYKGIEKNIDNSIVLLDAIPNNWMNCKLGNVFEIFVGATPSRKISEFWLNGDIYWVSSGEVHFNRITNTKEKITKYGLDNTSTSIHPVGTVVMAMIGEGKTRGQAAILKVPACHNQNTAAIRVSDIGLNPEFLFYYLELNYQRNRDLGSGNSQKALNRTLIQNLNYPLCSVSEQDEITSILDRDISNIECLQSAIASGLRKSETLRQSILRKAFEGKLVPQDPNEEPASDLLKRIQAEKKKYLEEQKEIKKRKPKNIKRMSKELSIEEVLKTSEGPMLARDVWQKSKHKGNIEEFYSELKKIRNKVEEVKKGTQSLLSLSE